MDVNTETQIKIIQQLIEYESYRYTVAIRDGYIVEAKAIKHLITTLQAELDTMPGQPYL